ncbi:MAG TPA: zinc dependent phospholipase C family protein [Anaerolineales bacterium]|nr:zinc dependent phospholipase C family protein [Anaerolineales bacterium]
MASWIVHLRVAEKLLKKIPGLDAEQFAIGNVAPDSGVPDEKWEIFDPPLEISHYKIENPDGPWHKLEDARFVREEILGKVSLDQDPARFSFLFGYFCHLATDNMWSKRIARPTNERYEEYFKANPDFIWEVKKDWYGLDFTYVRAHPDCLFWTEFLEAEYPVHYLSFFPPNAIPDKLEYIRTFYQRRDEKVEDELRLKNNIYLNEAEMALFVDGAYRSLYRIYQAVWERGESLEGLTSALEVLD